MTTGNMPHGYRFATYQDGRDERASEVERLEAEIERLTAAGIEPSAERALKTSAEAYRLVEEARQMRAERDMARAEVEGLREQLRQALARLSALSRIDPRVTHAPE